VNAVNVAIQPRKSLRFRGRSFMALVFAPEMPLEDWFRELDEWCRKSPGYFVGRPIILDVAALPLDKEGLAKLVADLDSRDIRIMGVEGAKASWLGLGMPPLVSGSRATTAESSEPPAAVKPVATKAATAIPAASPKSVTPGKEAVETPAESIPETPRRPATLLHDSPVRSGQSVIFPQGDVTIIGAVASGSEVVAGGSIHVYGTLRGRAIAGSTGNPNARIFCNKLEAELVAIDGLYRTADEMDPQFRGRPVQAWLDGETMAMATLA
jgi:septum site-determining protein MinC